jgi:uncharacterized membrane protein
LKPAATNGVLYSMNTPDDKKNISRHILPTSSNLLGITFVIFSLTKVLKLAEKTLLDELAALNMVIFLAASLFSYASIRARKNTDRYEKIADTFFIMGLILMTLISLIIALEVVI